VNMNASKEKDQENESVGNFSATLDAGHAKDLLKGLEALGDQTIFTFSENGLETGMVSNDVSTLLRCHLSSKLFEEYKFTGSDPIKLGVVLERIKDVTKTLTTKDQIKFEYDSQNPNVLIIDANNMRRTIRLVKLGLLREIPIMPVPETGWDYNFDIPLKAVKDYLRAVPKGLAQFSVIVNENLKSFTLLTTGDSPLELSLEPENWNCTASSRTHYGVDKLASGITMAKKTNAIVYGGDSLPMLIQWNHAEDFKCECGVAPRMK